MEKIEFYKSVASIAGLPSGDLPEIVLCGRSNVGKSSFINSLFNRKKLAKTSSTPGKTQCLNYYNVNDKCHIVDLPGFGYAKVSLKERAAWKKLIDEYFNHSKNISLIFHFVDSRHKPTKLDIMLNSFLNQIDVPYNVVLSKVDKLNNSEKSKTVKHVKQAFPELSLNDNLFLFSTVKGLGRKEILSMLSKLYF